MVAEVLVTRVSLVMSREAPLLNALTSRILKLLEECNQITWKFVFLIYPRFVIIFSIFLIAGAWLSS